MLDGKVLDMFQPLCIVMVLSCDILGWATYPEALPMGLSEMCLESVWMGVDSSSSTDDGAVIYLVKIDSL